MDLELILHMKNYVKPAQVSYMKILNFIYEHIYMWNVTSIPNKFSHVKLYVNIPWGDICLQVKIARAPENTWIPMRKWEESTMNNKDFGPSPYNIVGLVWTPFWIMLVDFGWCWIEFDFV